jgi:hypothetical protein
VWQLRQAFLPVSHASISVVIVVSVPFFKEDFLPPATWQMAHEVMGTSGLTINVCCCVMLMWQVVQPSSWLPPEPPPSCWKVGTLRGGNSALAKETFIGTDEARAAVVAAEARAVEELRVEDT